MSACTSIADPTARLACYDRASGRTAADTNPAAVPVAPEAAPAVVTGTAVAGSPVAAPPADTAATFGLSAERIAEVQQEPAEMTGTVASINDQAYPGRWVATLSNGHVWEQRETTSKSKRPRPGDTVTIRRAAFGSYMMTVEGRGASRVRRIR